MLSRIATSNGQRGDGDHERLRRTICAVFVLVVASSLASTGARAAGPSSAGDARTSDQKLLFAQLEKTDAVQEGAQNAKSVLYIFFDANCLYCHLTWKALQPYEREGLQVRWVPVAYQKPTSAGRAAAIIQASDRAAALHINETGYKTAEFDGGIQPLDKVPPNVAAQLEANTELMKRFGAPGTPALVWKDRDGKIRFKAGVPRLSELPQITGLPAQPNDDPELARFR